MKKRIDFTISDQCRQDADHSGPLISASASPRKYQLPDGGTIIEHFSFKENIGSNHATLSTASVLIQFSDDLTGQTVLEMGCGTGLLSLIAAKAGARVISTEIDPLALLLTEKNALANQVRLDIRSGSLCHPLHNDERFNWCICNLPQKPDNREGGLPISQSGGSEGDLLMAEAVSCLKNHQRQGDKLLFFSHSLTHHRLLKHISLYYHIELCSWKLRWFLEDEYGDLQQIFRNRHARETSFVWTETGREAMIGCVWLCHRLDNKA